MGQDFIKGGAMTDIMKKNRLQSDIPSLVSGFFDDTSFWNIPGANDWKTRIPAANIKDTEDEFVVDLAVPGMKKNDFHINIEDGSLTISAEIKSNKTEEATHFTRREFNYCSFSRSFVLPGIINEEDILARYEDGVLTITLPKREVRPISHREIKIS